MPAEKKACATAWRALVGECEGLEVDEGWHRGHIPDVCAGGKPGPGGCFLPQIGIANSGLGGQCSRYK
jgi:hypothetical protein